MGPLAGLGLLLAAVVFLFVKNIQANATESDLKARASRLASDFTLASGRYATAAELLAHLEMSARAHYDVRSLYVVDRTRDWVVAATREALVNTSALDRPELKGLTQSEYAWRHGHHFFFASPISVADPALRARLGRDAALVVEIDGAEVAARQAERTITLLAVIALGALALLAAVYVQFRRLVVHPVRAIQAAIEHPEVGHTNWCIPVVRSDEIGELAQVLEDSVRRLTAQEQFQSSIFDNLSGGAYRVSAKSGKILLATRGLREIFGTAADFVDLFGGASALEKTDAYREVMEAVGNDSEWEVDYPLAGDTWFTHRGRAIYDERGRPLYYDGLLWDVTERKRRDDRLQIMSEAIETGSNELWVLDSATLAIEYANKAALANTGYTREEIHELSVPHIAVDILNEEVAAELLQQVEASNEIRYCYTHQRKDGSTYPFEFHGVQVQQGDKQLVVAMGSDVSARIAHEQRVAQSEERLSLALEGSQHGVFDFADDRIYLSEGIRRWLHAIDRDVTLEDAVQAIHPADRKVFDQVMASHLDATPREFNEEIRVRNPFGGSRWLHVRGTIRYGEGGMLERVAGVASDITRRKQAESLAQRSSERLATVLDHVAEGVVTLSEEGTVIGANPAALDMFRVEEADLVGSHFVEWFVTDGVISIAELAHLPSMEAVGIRVGRENFACEVALREMDQQGDERYTAVIHDISERKRVEAELREAMEEAQAATKAKGEFLATMSHEIRTPMNGVLGMTQLLLDLDLDREQRDIAEVIFSSGEVLLTLINDILDFSKIEAGKLDFENAPFDLEVAVRDVMDLLSGAGKDKALDLYVEYDANLPRYFVGDVARVRQVLMNLVGNAIKFTDAGHVLLGVEASKRGVKVWVRDTGPGLDQKTQKRLFESFTQADASTTRKFGGTGLGLAICKQLVGMMGGDIGVESRVGEGANFWFTLELPIVAGVPGQHRPAVPSLAGVKTLVVDDNPVGRRVLGAMAAGLGAEVTTAPSGEAALQCLAEANFNLLLLDYHMPEMDGIQLARAVRERKDTTPIVMLSSSEASSSDDVDAIALKPVMRVALGEICKRVLDQIPEGMIPQVEVPAPNKAPHDNAPSERRIRILLAEDNAVNQKVATRMLNRIGCDVDVAENGQQAVAMWQQQSYQMIFMDCQMPEIDGLEATRLIRETETRAQHIPIVAMTANAMEGDRDACIAAGMDDYAAKPVKIAELKALVERYTAGTALP